MKLRHNNDPGFEWTKVFREESCYDRGKVREMAIANGYLYYVAVASSQIFNAQTNDIVGDVCDLVVPLSVPYGVKELVNKAAAMGCGSADMVRHREIV
jgi:hypothetical protein